MLAVFLAIGLGEAQDEPTQEEPTPEGTPSLNILMSVALLVKKYDFLMMCNVFMPVLAFLWRLNFVCLIFELIVWGTTQVKHKRKGRVKLFFIV